MFPLCARQRWLLLAASGALAIAACNREPCTDATCDGIDNDCDGEVDEYTEGSDPQTAWYADRDGDGIGACEDIAWACVAPAHYAGTCGDCDDEDASVNPDQPEICGDGIDNDCDGGPSGCLLLGAESLDRADAILSASAAGDEAGSCVQWVGDQDGDGLDDLLVAAPQADAGGVNGGVAYLLPGDVRGEWGLERRAMARLLGQYGGDEAGSTLGPRADVNGDRVPDLLVAAPLNGTEANNAGAAYVVFGPVTGDVDLRLADATLYGHDNGDLLGDQGGLSAGDVNGDGIDDLLLGAAAADTTLLNPGAAYVVLGPLSGTSRLGDAAAILAGSGQQDGAGAQVATGGDLDGDGVHDIAISALEADGGGSNSGAVYVLLGPVSGTLELGAVADARLDGEGPSDNAGTALNLAADLDDDGLADLTVGATRYDGGGTSSGVLYVVPGSAMASSNLADAPTRLVGSAEGESLGWLGLSGAGDVDDDGVDDLAVGAVGSDAGAEDAGVVYLFYGPVQGILAPLAADAHLLGQVPGGGVGAWVALGGDADGDGASDLLIGAPWDDKEGAWAGAAYLVLGGRL